MMKLTQQIVILLKLLKKKLLEIWIYEFWLRMDVGGLVTCWRLVVGKTKVLLGIVDQKLAKHWTDLWCYYFIWWMYIFDIEKNAFLLKLRMYSK